MEIVQTMNSDPGLAVGKCMKPPYCLVPGVFFCQPQPNALTSSVHLCRLHSIQWSRLWGNISREHSDRRWLCWLHLRLPGLVVLLRGDVETDGTNVLAGCALQSSCWAGNTAQGKWLLLCRALIQSTSRFAAHSPILRLPHTDGSELPPKVLTRPQGAFGV